MTTMRRVMRMAGATAVIAAIAAALLVNMGSAAAGNGHEQWVAWDNGCYYFWDGYGYTIQSCPRGDGAFDIALAVNGQWVPAYVVGYDAAGCFFAWDGVQYVAYTCPTTTMVIGGGSLYPEITIISPDGTVTQSTGGSVWQPTGIPEIDQIMIDANAYNVAIWLQPTCVERVGHICYVD